MKFNTGSHGVQSKTIVDRDVTTVKFVLPHSKDMATCSYSEFLLEVVVATVRGTLRISSVSH